MRTQIATNVSLATRRQADELVERRGYTLRDVVTIGIRMLHQEEFAMDSYQLLQNMETAAKNSDSGIVAIDSTEDGHHYFTFTSAYSAPKKWSDLGKWSKRLYPSGETVSQLEQEIDEWIGKLSS